MRDVQKVLVRHDLAFRSEVGQEVLDDLDEENGEVKGVHANVLLVHFASVVVLETKHRTLSVKEARAEGTDAHEQLPDVTE